MAKLLKDLRQGLADGNAGATQRAAHTLKGAARIMAAHQLVKISADLEVLARDQQLDAVGSRLAELESAVNQACRRIEAWQG